jgi:hypothetical protein
MWPTYYRCESPITDVGRLPYDMRAGITRKGLPTPILRRGAARGTTSVTSLRTILEALSRTFLAGRHARRSRLVHIRSGRMLVVTMISTGKYASTQHRGWQKPLGTCILFLLGTSSQSCPKIEFRFGGAMAL